MWKLLPKLTGTPREGLLPARFAIASSVKASAHAAGFAILQVETGRVHLCYGAAAKMWSAIADGDTTLEIADRMSREYSISLERAITSLNTFLRDLLRRRLIVRERAKPYRTSGVFLLGRVVWDLLGYDLRVGLFGFRAVHRRLERLSCRAFSRAVPQRELIERVVRAVSLASSLYWRPVQCLQRSIVAARLLRKFGVPAQLVIGYRMDPFLSHAWLEVNGSVVNDFAALPRNLTVLHRI